MLAASATCFVHATTSSFQFSVCFNSLCWSTSGAGSGVMPTSGTFCTYVPLLPGSAPASLNCSLMYFTVSSSPWGPGARPSYSSDDRTFVWASRPAASIDGSCPSGRCCDGGGGGNSGGGAFGSDEQAVRSTVKRTEKEHETQVELTFCI